MIDDIESRLRRPATAPNWATADSWMLEAADEIAALRKEVARLRAALQSMLPERAPDAEARRALAGLEKMP